MIRRARPQLLTAPLSESECVYWEVNDALGAGAPSRCQGVEFWLEDETGQSVLVRPDDIDVDARAELRTEAISIVESDIKQVSERLYQIKQKKKQASGATASKLHAEHKRLKRLATLLCAIGAHARGNVHVGGNLRRQEQYIAERSREFEDEGGQRTLNLMRERFEVILTEGAEIEVSGLCVRELIPAELGLGGGYRDAPTCIQMRAPAGGQLLVRGLGATSSRHSDVPEPTAESGALAHPATVAVARYDNWLIWALIVAFVVGVALFVSL